MEILLPYLGFWRIWQRILFIFNSETWGSCEYIRGSFALREGCVSVNYRGVYWDPYLMKIKGFTFPFKVINTKGWFPGMLLCIKSWIHLINISQLLKRDNFKQFCEISVKCACCSDIDELSRFSSIIANCLNSRFTHSTFSCIKCKFFSIF